MRKYIVFLFSFLSTLSFSQISAPDFDIYLGASAGVGDTKPFWNVSNQYGLYSTDPFGGLLGIALESADGSDSYLNIDYGFGLYGRLDQNPELFIPKAFVEVKIPFLLFRAGRQEEIIGNQDSVLSIGSTVWSMNAHPMPKLVLETPGYVEIPFTKGYAEINGSLSHGWFERDRYVNDVFLHHKQLHLRLGGDFFINGSLGIIHFAQWGGSSPNPDYGDLPSDWDAYKRVFFAQRGDSASVHANESINTLGNHLGSWNLRLDVKAGNFTSSAYFQSIFEDNSGMINPFEGDGLLGVSLVLNETNRIVNHLVFEYLNTTYQSGPVHDLSDSIKLTGNDNYFNNYIYQSGWTYKGMTLGTPLITSPVFNEDGSQRIQNNRVRAFHLGIGGILGRVNYRSFFTFSINKGTYSQPYEPDKNQFSWYFEAMVPSLWQGIDMTLMFAADMGQMYGNNLGLNLLFRKTFKPFN